MFQLKQRKTGQRGVVDETVGWPGAEKGGIGKNETGNAVKPCAPKTLTE